MKQDHPSGRILIVDDNPSNIKILQERLEDFELLAAKTGEEALVAASDFKPDLVLLDIMMPGLNGYEVCRQLKSDPSLSYVKIIMVSAKALREERLKGYEAGADDYIVKPFDGQELLAKVRVYLRLKSTEEFNQTLKTEVEEQTKALRLAKEIAEEANRSKNRFISVMTHELRNPLTAIMGFSSLMIDSLGKSGNDKHLHYVNIIKDSSDHLANLVSDIFDVVKIDRDVVELRISSFSSTGFVDSVINMVRHSLQEKGLEIESWIDPDLMEITGDLKRCKQILTNLLTNAIKYTDAGGNISVRLEKTDEATVKVSVTDTGIGIAPEHQKNLFAEFYQVNRERDESLGGTGIGLALTQRLVKLHGGEIGVDSEPGKGSTFWFSLPITPNAAPEKMELDAAFAALPRSWAGRRVMLVEDHEANQATVIELLDRHDVEVMTAVNGVEAIELAKYRKPDLILMDLRMPVMDGFATTEKIRALPDLAEIPIIALSANQDKPSVERAMNAGCDEFAAKPIEASQLNTILDKYFTVG